MKAERNCSTCLFSDVDASDEPCFKCQSTYAFNYRNWQPKLQQPVVHPVGEAPYLIKSDPTPLSIMWSGLVVPTVGAKLEVVNVTGTVIGLKQYVPITLAEWQKRQLVKDTLSEWRGGTTEDNMLVLVDKVLDAIGRRDAQC